VVFVTDAGVSLSTVHVFMLLMLMCHCHPFRDDSYRAKDMVVTFWFFLH
jgi:hypothetical protein